MTEPTRTPLYSDEDHELLGFIAKESSSWIAETIFGYVIERTTSKHSAEAVLQDRGLTYTMGVWQYFDKDEHDWFSCIITKAGEHRVTVLRTNAMGVQDPNLYKVVTLLHPTENTLIKSQ